MWAQGSHYLGRVLSEPGIAQAKKGRILWLDTKNGKTHTVDLPFRVYMADFAVYGERAYITYRDKKNQKSKGVWDTATIYQYNFATKKLVMLGAIPYKGDIARVEGDTLIFRDNYFFTHDGRTTYKDLDGLTQLSLVNAADKKLAAKEIVYPHSYLSTPMYKKEEVAAKSRSLGFEGLACDGFTQGSIYCILEKNNETELRAYRLNK